MTTSSRAAGRLRCDAVALLLRLGIGSIFLFAGLQKVAGGGVAAIAYFDDLGVPAPALVAPAIGYLELIGGGSLLIGAATRWLAVLFAIEMMVAIPLARLSLAASESSITGAFGAVRLEILVLIAAICLIFLGSGRWSADELLAASMHSGRRAARKPADRSDPSL